MTLKSRVISSLDVKDGPRRPQLPSSKDAYLDTEAVL